LAIENNVECPDCLPGELCGYHWKEPRMPSLDNIVVNDGSDFIKNPSPRTPVEHYDGDIECIDAMKQITTLEGFIEHTRLTAFKYLWRLGKKDVRSKELKKVRDYVDWCLEAAEEDEKNG